jgi:hypothetical protein
VPRVSPVLKIAVFLIPLAVCAGRMRASDPTLPSELNRCLAALRAVCSRRIRSPHEPDEKPAAAPDVLPLQQQELEFRLHFR